MNDTYWMNEAYKLAVVAQEKGEVPVGAVVVCQNKIIGSGFNQSRMNHDPTAHAEMNALRNAGQALGNYRLANSTLYVTLEPCVMCAGALVHARVARLVFSCRDFKTGAAGSVFNYLCGFPLNHQVCIDEGIMQHSCSELITNFFRKKTAENRGK